MLARVLSFIARDCVKMRIPPGFSRVVLQLSPRDDAVVIFLETTDFSRVEFQVRPSSTVQGR